MADMIDQRQYHGATVLLNGTVLVAGGYTADKENAIANAELFDPESSIWVSADVIIILFCWGRESERAGRENAGPWWSGWLSEIVESKGVHQASRRARLRGNLAAVFLRWSV